MTLRITVGIDPGPDTDRDDFTVTRHTPASRVTGSGSSARV